MNALTSALGLVTTIAGARRLGSPSETTARRSGSRDMQMLDLQIAELARRHATRHPAEAHSVLAAVERRLPFTTWLRGSRARASWVRSTLLDPARLREDLARDDVVVVDGWVLARSEATAAIYLAQLDA